jgi:hypothetical protein
LQASASGSVSWIQRSRSLSAIAERLVLGDGGRRLVFLPGRGNVPDVLIIGLTARPRRTLPRPAPWFASTPTALAQGPPNHARGFPLCRTICGCSLGSGFGAYIETPVRRASPA